MKQIKIHLVVILLFSLTQCKDKNEEPKISANNDLEHALYSGGSFDEVPKKKEVIFTKDSVYEEGGHKWKCTRTTYDIEDGIGGSTGFPLFNPNANVIYPGSMLQGKSLRKATPDVIAVERAGGTISYDIIDGSTGSSFTVEEVSKSSITNAMNSIISNNTTLPANFSFSYTHIQSREQFALEVNADFQNAFLELEGKFAMETDNSYENYLVRLDQQFYTMSFDIPTDKSQLFGPNVTQEELRKYVGPGNPATYISDVTYGRIYYLLIESTSSATDLEAAISGSFSGIAASGSGSVEASYYNDLSDLKVKMFAYGGEAGGTLQTAGSLDIQTLSEKLAATGDIRSGKPLSYVVRNAYDNQIVAMPVATKYDVVTCEQVSKITTPPAVTAHWGTSISEKIGDVGAIIKNRSTDNDFIVVNKAGTEYLYDNGTNLTGPFSVTDDMFAGKYPMNDIGAAGEIFIVAGLFNVPAYCYINKTGNMETYYQHGTSTFSTPEILGSMWANCPFNAQGIGAVTTWRVNNTFVFNKEGNQYSTKIDGTWTAAKDISNWEGIPFTKVGAMGRVKVGVNTYILVFNGEGNKYTLFDNQTGNFTEAFDL